MKKQYQIDREEAVRKFQQQARHSEESLQLTLPLKQVAAALQEGVGRLMRDAGLELMQLIMDNEVRQLAGERYERRAPEQPFRWGHENGFLVVDGQKVPIERPRLRDDDGEQRLGSYELFRRSEPLDEAVWDKLMLGLSTRNYSKAVRTFAASYGIEKSAVSDHFVRVSREKLRELLERPLGPTPALRDLSRRHRIQGPTSGRGAGSRRGRGQNGSRATAGSPVKMQPWSVSCWMISSSEASISRYPCCTCWTVQKR